MGQPNGAYVFAAGAVAGIVEGLSIQPLTVPVIQKVDPTQLQNDKQLQEIVREGGLRQLYRGGLPEIAGSWGLRQNARFSPHQFEKVATSGAPQELPSVRIIMEGESNNTQQG
eukprot:1156675-Pelagomonas_calceolata.AAC.3